VGRGGFVGAFLPPSHDAVPLYFCQSPKLCHSERSKIVREANDLAESRNLLFAGGEVTLNTSKAAADNDAPVAKRRKIAAQGASPG
jgi:hypothetical protein